MEHIEARKDLKNRKRIVIKIGSSSLTHPHTGHLDLIKIEVLVREISDLLNRGKEVILVSSGAIMVGSRLIGFHHKPGKLALKQACASIGQAKLMMIYQKLFNEYNQTASQILLTNYTLGSEPSCSNARNTLEELLKLKVVPIVNENDTVATEEIEVGDNDTLSAAVARLVGADLLILLSDIDGLFTNDPNIDPDARFIGYVEQLDDRFFGMAKNTSSSGVGTGGMSTKLGAARSCMEHGCDMIIANGRDFHIIHELINGEDKGTLFKGGNAK